MSLDQGVKMVPAKWGGLVCGHVKYVTFSNHLKVIADTKVGWILCWEVKLNQCVLRSLFDIVLWLSSSYKHGDNILNIGMRSELVLLSITS